MSTKEYYDFEVLMTTYISKATKEKIDDFRTYYPPLTTDLMNNNARLAQVIETFLTIVRVREPKKSDKILEFMYGYKNSKEAKLFTGENDLVLNRLKNGDDKAIDDAYSFLESIIK